MLEDDMDYVSRFLSYLASHHLNEKIKFNIFTKFDLFVHEIQKDTFHYPVVISDRYFDQWSKEQIHRKVIWLTDQISDSTRDNHLEIRLFRFQPLHQLCNRLFSLCTLSTQFQNKQFQDPLKIISIFSSVGHSGKSLVSLALAKQLSSHGHKILFLNLEDHSTSNQLMGWTESHDFSNLMYYLRSTHGESVQKISQYICHDEKTGIHYVPICLDDRELYELQAEDMKLLMDAFRKFSQYEYLIIDLPSSFYPRTRSLFSLSDYILWLLIDDINCFCKTKTLQRYIEFTSNVYFIVNKFTGQLYNDYASLNISPSGYLPYIPDWENIFSTKQFTNIQWFEEQVYEIFKKSYGLNSSLNHDAKGESHDWSLKF